VSNGQRRLDRLGLACVVTNANAREVQSLGVDVNKQRGPLPFMDTTPALAKSTAGVKLTGKAEKATTAELEALEPEACGKTVHRHETLLQGEAGHEVERLLQKGECEVDPQPQGSLNEGKHRDRHDARGAVTGSRKLEVPPRVDPTEGRVAV